MMTYLIKAAKIIDRKSPFHQKKMDILVKLILNSVDYENRSSEIDFSTGDKIVVTGARELEIMNRHLMKKGKFMF